MAVHLEPLASEAFYNFGFMALDAGERAFLGPLHGLAGLVTGFAKNKALEFTDQFLQAPTEHQNQPKSDLTNTIKEAGSFALQSLYFMGTGALTSFGTQFLFRNKAFATLADRAFKNYAPLLVPQLAHLLTNPAWQLGLQFLTGQPLHLPTWEQLAMSTFSSLGGMAMGINSNPSIDTSILHQNLANHMEAPTLKNGFRGPVPVSRLSEKVWLNGLANELSPHFSQKKGSCLEVDVGFNVENDTIKPCGVHIPPKRPEKEHTHLTFSFSKNEDDTVTVRFVDLKQGTARKGDTEQAIMHLAGNPALSEYPPRLQEARADYLLNGKVLGLQRRGGRWNYDGCNQTSFHERWAGHKLEDIFGSDPCFQHLPPAGIEILYTGTMDGKGNLRRMGCYVENSGQIPSDHHKYFKIRFKLSPHQNEESSPNQTTKALLVSADGPGSEAMATSMHLKDSKTKTEGPLDRDVGKPVPLQIALGLDDNTLTMDNWYRLLTDPEYSSASLTKIATHLEARGNDLSHGVMISGQIRKENMVSLTTRPGNKPALTGGGIAILVSKKNKNGDWIYTQVDGARLPVMHSKLLLGQGSFDPDLTPNLVTNTLTLELRGEDHLQAAGYRLLTLEEAAGLAGNSGLANAWGKIRQARPNMTFEPDRPIGVLVASNPRPNTFQLCINPEGEIPRGDHVNAIPLYAHENGLAYREPLPRLLPKKIKEALKANTSLFRIEGETPELQTPPLARVKKTRPPKTQKAKTACPQPRKAIAVALPSAFKTTDQPVQPIPASSDTTKPSTQSAPADKHLKPKVSPPSPTALTDQDDLRVRREALVSSMPPLSQLGALRLSDRLTSWCKGVDTRSPTYQHASTSLGRIENFACAQRLAHELTKPGLSPPERSAMITDRLPPLLERLFSPISHHPDFSSEEPKIRFLFGKALQKPDRFLITFEGAERRVTFACLNQVTNQDAVSEALGQITGTLERETQNTLSDHKGSKRKK